MKGGHMLYITECICAHFIFLVPYALYPPAPNLIMGWEFLEINKQINKYLIYQGFSYLYDLSPEVVNIQNNVHSLDVIGFSTCCGINHAMYRDVRLYEWNIAQCHVKQLTCREPSYYFVLCHVTCHTRDARHSVMSYTWHVVLRHMPLLAMSYHIRICLYESTWEIICCHCSRMGCILVLAGYVIDVRCYIS